MPIGRVGFIGQDRFTGVRRCTVSSAVMKPGTETRAGFMTVQASTAADSMVEAMADKDSHSF
jgi:hypothetical protein